MGKLRDQRTGASRSESGNAKLGAAVGLLVLAGAGMGVYTVFPTANNSGYAPEQPIPFSHKIHAGINKIDCQYCHSNVTKSRHATIPSMNVCMNCHRVVKTESPYIQKLHEHFKAGKPIEWVRVHELPDFVQFNHRPHVRQGISCETCHGQVAEMDTIMQSATLEMGWCVQCHRGQTTPPDVLKRIHTQAKAGTGTAALLPEGHVARTDCSTCHH